MRDGSFLPSKQCGGRDRRISLASECEPRFAPVRTPLIRSMLQRSSRSAPGPYLSPGQTEVIFCRSVSLNPIHLEYRKVNSLTPYGRNPRTHSDAQVAKIAASIVEYGWTNPILIDGENGIVAGHGRLAAARQLGLTEVPVIELSHLSPTQKRAYVIADNQLALEAGWNEELLALELQDLEAEGFDLALTGFDEEALAELMAGDEPDHPGSRHGVGIAASGHTRAGLEDNMRLDKHTLAPSNAALIKRAADICEQYERPVATFEQAREMLGLRPFAA